MEDPARFLLSLFTTRTKYSREKAVGTPLCQLNHPTNQLLSQSLKLEDH